MPGDKKEPQSYGSQADWVTGNTDQQVNDQKAVPPPQHEDFYDERRESETTHEDQGGKISPVQAAETTVQPGRGRTNDEQPITKVTTAEGGAKRDSFFRKRDYQ
jgi:hypothetical protein